MNLNVADPNGLPLDLTGYTVSMSMKKSFHAKKRIDFVVEIVDAIKGKVKVSLDETVTALIPAIRYVYTCTISGGPDVADPIAMRFMEGIVNVTPTT